MVIDRKGVSQKKMPIAAAKIAIAMIAGIAKLRRSGWEKEMSVIG